MLEKKCEQCGKIYYVAPSRKTSRFCTMRCYQNSRRRNRVRRVCEICNKEFFVIPSRVKKGGGKFCSPKCCGKARSKQIKGEGNPQWKGGEIERICETCGKKFYAKASDVKRGGAKFCSRECLFKLRIGENCPTWKGGKSIKRICETCGNEFLIYPNQMKREVVKFCSPSCYYEDAKGEKSAHWKGGLSFEPYCAKFNFIFKEYIREKFGRICFLCSKTEEENGKRLSVHHVNYNKNCGCDDDETCQFIPLCVGCNTKVNHNRRMWEKKIKRMMRNTLNGWYI